MKILQGADDMVCATSSSLVQPRAVVQRRLLGRRRFGHFGLTTYGAGKRDACLWSFKVGAGPPEPEWRACKVLIGKAVQRQTPLSCRFSASACLFSRGISLG